MRVFQNSFVSGSLDPALAGRVDLQAYFQAAAELNNFVVKSSGSVTKRMGTDLLQRLDNVSNAYFFPVYKNREEAFIGYLTPAENGSKGKIQLLNSSLIVVQLDETNVGTWRNNKTPPFREEDYLASGAFLTPDFESAYRTYWKDHVVESIAIPINYGSAASAAAGESYGVRVGKLANNKWSTTTNAHLLFNEPGGFREGSVEFSLPALSVMVTTKVFIECPGVISELIFNPIDPDYAFLWEESDITAAHPTTGTIVVSYTTGGSDVTQEKANGIVNVSGSPIFNNLPKDLHRVQVYKSDSTTTQVYEIELRTNDLEYCISYSVPIEIEGEGWFRYRNTNALAVLEHDFTADELSDVTHVQSGDTVFFFHPNRPTLMLKRISDVSWVVEKQVLDTLPEAPSGLNAQPTGFPEKSQLGSTEQKYAVQNTIYYGVSAVYKGKESGLSNTVSVNHWSSWTQGGKVKLTWNAPTGQKPVEYNVWKKSAGMWGWIGAAEAADKPTFTDTNISPSYQYGVTNTNPVFSDTNSNAGAGTFFEQRMVLTRYGEDSPHAITFSAVGDIFNFFDHTPVTEADAFQVTIATTEHAAIRWIVAQQDRLMIFTESSEYIADTGNSTQGFSGLSARFRVNSRYGVSSGIPPLSTGGNLLFVRNDARSVIDYSYQVTRDAMQGVDRNVLSRHLLEGDAITSMAYQQSPDSIIWFTTRGGRLLSLTYLPEHEVYAWSQHTLAGDGKAMKVLSTGAALKHRNGTTNYDADELYVVVSRLGVLHVERLRPGLTSGDPDLKDAYTLDAAHIIRAGMPIPVSPLEGQAGVVWRNLSTGEGGELEGGWSASQFARLGYDVILGFPVTATLKTLRPEPPEGSLLGLRKRVVSVLLRLLRSRGVVVRNASNDPSFDCRVRESFEGDELFTGDTETCVDGRWNTEGQVQVTSSDIFPTEILALVYDLEVEGDRG